MLRAGGLLVAALPVLAACGSPFATRRLTVAAGVAPGVYFRLAGALAEAWGSHLGLDTPPLVLTTAGSNDNLERLVSGAADVAFSQVDTVAELTQGGTVAEPTQGGTVAELPGTSPIRALARIYDDAQHVVVRRESALHRPADLRGARVSIGPPTSGYHSIARRILAAAGLDADRDVSAVEYGLAESAAALRDGSLDAFFWSGGLPTAGVTDLAASLPIRLLDLTDVLAPVRARHPVYTAGTVPASTYGIGEPVGTLFVRNLLLVPASMEDDLAAALVEAMLEDQSRLGAASPAALTIDARSAIGTQPIPLHPGAERFYRSTKTA